MVRTFGDRGVTVEDQEAVVGFVKELGHTVFSYDFRRLFGHLAGGGGTAEVTLGELADSLLFGAVDVGRQEGGSPGEGVCYDELTPPPVAVKPVRGSAPVPTPPPVDLTLVMESVLADCNSASTRPLSLVVSRYAVSHIIRILRVLKLPGGHCVLVGQGGSGREAVARLAAYMCGFGVFAPISSPSYSAAEWHTDLKRVVRDAGLNDTPVVLLVSRAQTALPQVRLRSCWLLCAACFIVRIACKCLRADPCVCFCVRRSGMTFSC